MPEPFLARRISLAFLLLIGAATAELTAQNATVRGNVYDGATGEALPYATVQLADTAAGTTTDLDGFFALAKLPAGTYEVFATYVGYDTARAEVTLTPNGIRYVTLTIAEGVSLGAVEVSAGRTQARTDVQVSKVSLTPSDLKALPSTGGEGDLAQYLPVLPGIVTTGDQGGQIFIRGGAPIQNKVLLDGVTIFNPFHSIGFYSVFETEAIQNVDVLTGGFGAQYGGRLSAVVDITSKVGNRKAFSGLVGVSPFQARILAEGPITKFSEEKVGSISYLVSAKRGLLEETGESFYSYANDSVGLPYGFTDVYAKVSTIGNNGSKAEFFGFNFADNSTFPDVAYSWNTFGAGTNFKLVPPASDLVIDGSISYSNYDSELVEPERDDRTSSLTNYTAKVNFNQYAGRNTLRYGFAFNGVRTEFAFANGFGQTLDLTNNNSELAAYATFKRSWDRVVIEPGIRLQYYASLQDFRPEPRLGVKVNATEWMRFKFAGGLYSQNLLSSVNERDVVNLFVGFISGPDEQVFDFDGVTPLDDRLQKAWHAIGGVEFDLAPGILLNVEPYFKDFTQLLAINRNKRTPTEPDYVVETGDARGIDFSLAYDRGRAYVWATYSYGKVERDDGEQVYPTIFDRRHNANLLVSYALDEDETFEVSARYNFGTGFPFTATRGFYGRQRFDGGINTDLPSTNSELGILFSPERNGERLPNYHRADVSARKTFAFGERLSLDVVASVTNVANRDNIFFVSRFDNSRTDQLPILPSLGATFHW